MIKLTIFLAYLFGSGADTSHLKSDFTLLGKSMSFDCYSANIQYKVYLDNKLAETSHSSIKMDGDFYHITLGTVTKINGKQYNVLLDEVNKVMVVSKSERNLKLLSQRPPIDSFLSKAQEIKESQIDSVTRRYSFTLSDCKEKAVQIDIDLTTYQIKRIFMVLQEPFVDFNNQEHEKSIEINYLKYLRQDHIPESVFSTEAYMKVKSKTISASDKTKDYSIVDLLNEKQ